MTPMAAARRAARSPYFVLATLLCAATAGLVALGYQATLNWLASTSRVVEQRTDVMIALLSTALSRDMKGVLVSVLLPLTPADLDSDPPYGLRDGFARAFARFPYAESFFLWRTGADGRPIVYVFHRAERPPPWDSAVSVTSPYPVVMRRDPPGARELIAAARRQAGSGERFLAFDLTLADVPYQVVVEVLHASDAPHSVSGLLGFTVNVPWARERYFPDLVREVARVGGDEGTTALVIRDERGSVVASTGRIEEGAPQRERRFPLVFLDASGRAAIAEGTLKREWTIQVGPTDVSPLPAARRGARRTVSLLVLAALATLVAMALTVRAARARAQLAAMQSEFVYTVTHELKSPLALIRLVGDTISMGRYSSAQTLREYSDLLSQQARRLTRLIDNLLAYARLRNDTDAYAFEPLDVVDLVEDAVEQSRARFEGLGFDLHMDIPADLPRVRADRTTVLMALDNLIDNAIKYSPSDREVAIRAQAADRAVKIEIADHGQGIPQAELGRVFEKFYRGRDVRAEGSGLGLAIVQRIVTAHGGRVAIASAVGQGTTVAVTLPIAS